MKKNIIMVLLTATVICSINVGLILANEPILSSLNEPIMEYKYTLQETKIKRAQFIWKTCIEKLRTDGVLADDDVKSINKYLASQMKSERFEGPSKIYSRQKKALRPTTIEHLVNEKIITPEQGGKLRDEFSKYDLSELEED
ncbi:MAG: hypothetical protein ACRC92_10360 [Peptostreptococcaceae bacterium]